MTARRVERLEALASELSAKHNIAATPIALDLADPESVQRLVAELGARGLAIDGLVNNAGYAVPGYYVRTAWKEQKDFLQVLVTAPCELTHALLPGMIERRFGRIVNVASVAGLIPGTPGHTLYAPAKAFMVKFSEALLLENRPHKCAHPRALPRLHAYRISRCGGRQEAGLEVRQGMVVDGGGGCGGWL